MTAMTTAQAAVGAVIIIGFLATLAGAIIFAALVIEDLRDRWQHRHFHPDAGRSESPPTEGPPAPIFPLDMARSRRRNRNAA